MAHDPYALSDEDRLPWLEPVDDVEAPAPGGAGRLIGFALVALVVLGIAFGGVWLWQSRTVEPTGSGELIAAPAGPYKVRPAEEGGMTIEGEGDMAFAASQGREAEGALDMTAVPEAPIDRAPVPAPAPQPVGEKPTASASAAVAKGGQVVAKAPPAAIAPEGPAGATVQLGAFATQEIARKTWEQASKRFAYLADRTESIVKADVNGRTYYRLRVGTGSAAEAKDVCARLAVAGEKCLVVN